MAFAIAEDESPLVIAALICEPCTYERRQRGTGPRMFWSWSQLVEHAEEKHWVKNGVKNGQPVYVCQHCSENFQLSRTPVVDFGGNIFCGSHCARASYASRLKHADKVHIIAQEERDLDYVKRSLGVSDD